MITSVVSSNFSHVAVHTFPIVPCVCGFFYQLSLAYFFLLLKKMQSFGLIKELDIPIHVRMTAAMPNCKLVYVFHHLNS